MRHALSQLDEFAIFDTSFGPFFREMISIYLVELRVMTRRAYDNAGFVFLSVFDGV